MPGQACPSAACPLSVIIHSVTGDGGRGCLSLPARDQEPHEAGSAPASCGSHSVGLRD